MKRYVSCNIVAHSQTRNALYKHQHAIKDGTPINEVPSKQFGLLIHLFLVLEEDSADAISGYRDLRRDGLFFVPISAVLLR